MNEFTFCFPYFTTIIVCSLEQLEETSILTWKNLLVSGLINAMAIQSYGNQRSLLHTLRNLLLRDRNDKIKTNGLIDPYLLDLELTLSSACERRNAYRRAKSVSGESLIR